MSKKQQSARCVYCLKVSKAITRDHVIPRSWYPAKAPRDMPKWKVPCCQECNNKYSKLEETLLLKLVLCTDPFDSLTSDISEKIKRSIKPQFAKNPQDRRIREASLRKLLDEIITSKHLPNNLLPNFGPRTSTDYPEYRMIEISRPALTAFGVKLVRGMTYALRGFFIENEYTVDVHFPTEDELAGLYNLIGNYPENYDHGPGIIIRRGVLENDGISAIYQFEIWSKFKLVIMVVNKNLQTK